VQQPLYYHIEDIDIEGRYNVTTYTRFRDTEELIPVSRNTEVLNVRQKLTAARIMRRNNKGTVVDINHKDKPPTGVSI
jgi:hypothetical protein